MATLSKADRATRLAELAAAFTSMNFDDKLMAEYKGLIAAEKKAEEEKEAIIKGIQKTIDDNGFTVEEIFTKPEIKIGAQNLGLIKGATRTTTVVADEDILIKRSGGQGKPAKFVRGSVLGKTVAKGFKDLYNENPSKFAGAIEEFITEAGKKHFATAEGKKDFAAFLEHVKNGEVLKTK